MGIGAGLGTLLAAGIGAVSAHHTQSANAAAQSSINEKTMKFNAAEALKAREFEHQEAAINRLFNQRSSNSAMAFSSNEAAIQRAYEANQVAIARSFNASEAAKERSWSSNEADLARDFNAQQSLLARQFEERMSNTAHQREVKDLRKAGLNPILSATGGSGAASPVAPVIGSPLPSGAAASAQAAHGSKGEGFSASGTSAKAIAASVGGLNAYMKKDVLSQFINTAMDGMRLNNDIKRANAADMEAKASLMNAKTNEMRQKVDASYIDQQIENLKKDNVFKDWQIKSEEEKVKLVKAEILKCAKEIEFGERVTAAREKEAGAIAYQAVKNADTEAAYKRVLGKVAEAHDSNEKEQLKQKAQELKYKFEEGQNGLERDWIKKHPYWAHTLVTVDKVMSAVSPIKLRPLQSD